MTANGTAQITTTSPKFGTGALLADGAGAYVSTPSHADFGYGTGDFTLDCWANFTSITTQQYLYTNAASTGLIFWFSGVSKLLNCYNGTSNFISTSWTPTAGTWYHLEWGRNSGTNYQFINGTLQNAGGTADSTNYGTTDCVIAGPNTVNLNGKMDEVRISKGICRHTANFTAPTAEYS